MKEKTVVTILAIIAILLVCSLIALFYLSRVTEIEVEQVPEPPRGNMAIYQNGLISLSYTKEVETSNPIILLPEGVMLDSIRIENVSGFREIKDSAQVHIETDMGDYTGKLLEENEDFIMIEVENRTVAIEKSRIKLYTQEPEKGVSIELFLNETNESRIKVSISYIIWGEPWYLNYDIDIESKVLQAETSVKSPVNVKNVDISLISGSPHIVSWYAEKLGAQRAPAVLKEMMISEGEREGEYYVYEIENATLKKDVLNVFKRFDSIIDLEKFYYWNSGMIEERLNKRCEFLAYPWGNYDDLVLRTLKQLNFLGGLTLNVGLNAPKTDPFLMRRVEARGKNWLKKRLNIYKSGLLSEIYSKVYHKI